ncbi:hypothetical protein [Dyadobacter jejuensis]|uniref:hypothetical protein n=1 Tax=Dyadobacter jejuensis TaxID=1082580 RepID=UPI0011B23C86|nr:hypothetical protein [Dyadobacter jejuensis]
MKTVKYLFYAIGLILASLFYLYPQVFYTHTLCLSDFERVDGDIYVSKHLEGPLKKQITTVVTDSQHRVGALFGQYQSHPRIVVCATESEYKRYCNSNVGAGCSVGTPWGLHFVVVHLQGINTDVMSHEMSHIELLERLGWWTVLVDVPQWFNEGLALMVDRRFVKSTNPVRRYRGYRREWRQYARELGWLLPLAQLEGMSAFTSPDPDRVMYAYMTSGKEVSRWQIESGPFALTKLIQKIKSGIPFAEAYEQVSSEAADRIDF